uniref:Uncharacterized protein n=1 Tax=Arundo donax TaxID=35708 RepID=A0A0A9FWZ8_ARUDO
MCYDVLRQFPSGSGLRFFHALGEWKKQAT